MPMEELKKEFAAKFIITLKELKICKRKLEVNNKRIRFTSFDRLFYAAFNKISSKMDYYISLVRPETVLKWYQQFIKKFWIFPHKSRKKKGRPDISKEIKELVLKIKNDNINIGYGKIQGELKKLGISMDKTTIRKILKTYRKKGKVKTGLTWKKFIKSHIDSLYAMDFFTLTSIFGKTYYIWFFMCIKTREIIHFNITTNPTKMFVRLQLNWVRDDFITDDKPIYLIHDNAGEFNYINYHAYNINSVPTSVKAPNLNAHAERFVGSIRRECFNWFILISEKQIRNLLKEYISYYNTRRPHQGIEQEVPKGYTPKTIGKVISKPVLSGLFYHYERLAA